MVVKFISGDRGTIISFNNSAKLKIEGIMNNSDLKYSQEFTRNVWACQKKQPYRENAAKWENRQCYFCKLYVSCVTMKLENSLC